MPFRRTFATDCTRTYVAVFFQQTATLVPLSQSTTGRKVPISGSSQCLSSSLCAHDRVGLGGRGTPLNAVNGPVLVHYLVVLTGLQTS
jgi:hypothetical protein